MILDIRSLEDGFLESTLGLEIIEVVEEAAIASAAFIGLGDKDGADQAAVEAMRIRMNKINMRGRIVIGEGERDDAPMLFIGEEVGYGYKDGTGPKIDIAVDPCEGTNLCAYAQAGSIAVLAASEYGGLFNAPDFYMKKLAAPPAAKGKVDIRKSATENLQILSQCLDRPISELTVVVMKRERHNDLIKEIRAAGARIQLIGDGDVGAAINCGFEGTGIHALIGIGAAPEGVITAAAMRCLGGHFQGQLVYDPAVVQTKEWANVTKEANLARLAEMNITDPDKVYETEELASGENMIFAATGITTCNWLRGVRYFEGGLRTETLIISSKAKTARFVETIHMTGNPKSVQLHG
jgi:fructose-1,6-bisphosphatase II / sedoheptulose-1,7-bisphosphatase